MTDHTQLVAEPMLVARDHESDWPFFDLVGPEKSCDCGCPRFERDGSGGWLCGDCGRQAKNPADQ